MNRNDVTELIIAAKVNKGLKWADVAEKIGLSKEWVTAGCLGQMTFTASRPPPRRHLRLARGSRQAAAGRSLQGLAADLGADRSADLPLLRADQRLWHDLQGTDPRGIRRRHHVRDRFQDGPAARAQPMGDRVSITMSGKFLPYKTY
jgi:cyanate lyase